MQTIDGVVDLAQVRSERAEGWRTAFEALLDYFLPGMMNDEDERLEPIRELIIGEMELLVRSPRRENGLLENRLRLLLSVT